LVFGDSLWTTLGGKIPEMLDPLTKLFVDHSKSSLDLFAYFCGLQLMVCIELIRNDGATPSPTFLNPDMYQSLFVEDSKQKK
jgi:hypothetical protein